MCRVIVMGACPHDDHAQSSNWGIFNQHIWGDYNQHSHMLLHPLLETKIVKIISYQDRIQIRTDATGSGPASPGARTTAAAAPPSPP
ncbi:hypothetical protein CT154_15315 [Komagataeibacter xylinus]|nr:hypothetical protein CT154_15315 [Komagataeibacter xylinus]